MSALDGAVEKLKHKLESFHHLLHEITEEAMRRTPPWPHGRASSQAPMLLMFGGSYAHLDGKWNVLGLGDQRKPTQFQNATAGSLPRALERGCIWHWNGVAKPWTAAGTSTQALWQRFSRPCCVQPEAAACRPSS